MSDIIGAIADLLWPLLALIVIWLFRPAVAAIVESAKSRKFSLKIGGQELTMEEANSQLAKEVADLRDKLASLENRPGPGPQVVTGDQLAKEMSESVGPSVLWVDDNPKNNIYIVEQLRNWGIELDLALSTDEGLTRTRAKRYDCIISDMSRDENGVVRHDAGFQLLSEIRKTDRDVYFYVFCSRRGVADWKEKVMAAGADGITFSGTELLSFLKRGIRRRST